MMWPTHCVQGSFGCEYHKDLVLKETDHEVLKGQIKMVESYSAFGNSGENTGLTEHLRNLGVTKCFCVGLAFDYCVGSTAEDGAKAMFNTYLIDDAAKAVNDATRETMNGRLKTAGVTVIKLDELK